MELKERIEEAEAREEEGREEAGDGEVFVVIEPVTKDVDLALNGSVRKEIEEEEVLHHLRGELVQHSKAEEGEGKGGKEGRDRNAKWRGVR